LGKKTARKVLEATLELLEQNPPADTRNMKSLRPNRFADREVRLFGKYRVLFSVDEEHQLATILLVGEKRGDKLLVLGKEFSEHHESDSIE
jgi:mRNA-degrading endonuclease RelE of RelBE toxin-antitoxin system